MDSIECSSFYSLDVLTHTLESFRIAVNSREWWILWKWIRETIVGDLVMFS
jgi:hypothetical protein